MLAAWRGPHRGRSGRAERPRSPLRARSARSACSVPLCLLRPAPPRLPSVPAAVEPGGCAAHSRPKVSQSPARRRPYLVPRGCGPPGPRPPESCAMRGRRPMCPCHRRRPLAGAVAAECGCCGRVWQVCGALSAAAVTVACAAVPDPASRALWGRRPKGLATGGGRSRGCRRVWLLRSSVAGAPCTLGRSCHSPCLTAPCLEPRAIWVGSPRALLPAEAARGGGCRRGWLLRSSVAGVPCTLGRRYHSRLHGGRLCSVRARRAGRHVRARRRRGLRGTLAAARRCGGRCIASTDSTAPSYPQSADPGHPESVPLDTIEE
jgi:hypothetical protein